MPGPIELAVIIAGSIVAGIAGFRWGRHAAQTMCRQDHEGDDR